MEALGGLVGYMKKILPLLLVLLVTTAVYLNSLQNPFVRDDWVIISQNDFALRDLSFGYIFQHSLFGTQPPGDGYFRPLTLLTFALNSQFAQANPAGYRIVNISLHLLVVAIVFAFFSHLTQRWIGAFGALLFAVHPVNVQAVSYISSRSELLYTLIGLLCVLCWRQGGQTQGGRRRLYLSFALIAFFIGLFAKETMVVIPVLIVMMDIMWSRFSWRQIKENVGWYGGFVLLFWLYLWVRLGSGAPLTLEGARELDFISRVAFALKLLALNLGVVFYPVHLSLFRVVSLPDSPWEWQVILGLLLVFSLLIAAYFLWRWREIPFGLLWFLIAILPALNLTLLNYPMMEHWLYLPLIGLVLALVGSVRRLADRVGNAWLFAVGLCLVSLLLSIRTVERNREWRDLIRLFSQDVRMYPGNPLAWMWLGESLVRRGMFDDAIRVYEAGLTINPGGVGIRVFLGEALFLAGRKDEAGKVFSTAISISPKDRPRIEDFRNKCCRQNG